jgi:hypothetical protein
MSLKVVPKASITELRNELMVAPMIYCDPPDVPEGMTLAEYRAQRRCGDDVAKGRVARLRSRARARAVARRAVGRPRPAA